MNYSFLLPLTRSIFIISFTFWDNLHSLHVLVILDGWITSAHENINYHTLACLFASSNVLISVQFSPVVMVVV